MTDTRKLAADHVAEVAAMLEQRAANLRTMAAALNDRDEHPTISASAALGLVDRYTEALTHNSLGATSQAARYLAELAAEAMAAAALARLGQ